MNPVFEVCLTAHCNFRCDYCIAHTETLLTAEDDNGRVTSGWLFPTALDDDTFKKQSDGSWRIKYTPIICRVPDTDEACIARNAKNKQNPICGKPVSDVAINLDKLLTFIHTHLKGWDIVLSGGEPLILDKFDQFVMDVTRTNDVKILSNVSKIRREKFVKLLKNERVQWKVGYHPEFRDVEDFKESINFMKKYTDRFHVNFVKHPRMEKDNFKNFFKYKKVLDGLDIKYDVTMFKGEWEGKVYGDLWKTKENTGKEIGDNMKYISDHAIPMANANIKMWDPGQTFLTAYSDGRVFECHNAVKELGNINDNELTKMSCKEYLGCINCGTSHCDSMNGYRFMNKIHDKGEDK